MNPVSPHALDVVDRLSARFPVALATSGSASSAALFLDRNQATHKATPLFQAVVTSADVVHAKPSPEIFLAAASRLGIPAEDCLVIEDSVSGIQAARAAGCRVWGFTMAGQPKPLREAGAERVLASLAELLPLVRCNQQRIWESTESAPAPQAAGWTTVIPAAGRGTRLGFDQPKILFPLGRTHHSRLAARSLRATFRTRGHRGVAFRPSGDRASSRRQK